MSSSVGLPPTEVHATEMFFLDGSAQPAVAGFALNAIFHLILSPEVVLFSFEMSSEAMVIAVTLRENSGLDSC